MQDVETLTAAPSGGIPNHPRWPALICRATAEPSVEGIGALFRGHGWGGLWDGSILTFHHYHPASHEVLGVAEGHAGLHLGGPDGAEVEVSAGDVLILPAGFGHKRLSSAPDFRVVGAYPPGQDAPEIARADPDRIARVLPIIEALPRPERDPTGGATGPILRHWT